MPPLSPFSKSCIALAVAHSLSLQTVHAATIEVTSNLDDDSNCTLREALASTNAGTDLGNGCDVNISNGELGSNDTITFGAGVGGTTITLANSQLSITSNVSINPDGANTTINANPSSQVLRISGGTVALDQLTITGGGRGGIGVLAGADVSLSNSSVSGNISPGFSGGGITVYAGSSVSLINSTVSGNSSRSYGGGLSVSNYSTVSLINSTVSRNSAALAAGVFIAASDVSLINSTVSGNFTGQSGGGIFAYSSSISLSNSTISGNSAAFDGGGILVLRNSSVSLSNSTMSGNSAGTRGSAINAIQSSVSLSNSILANSIGVDACYSNQATITVAQDSVIDDDSCGMSATIMNPLLGPLADNGGPTFIHALLPGSPAIDNASGAGATTADQRGFGVVGSARDSGAFEYGSTRALDLTVTSIEDDNGAGCTLREAIATVNEQQNLDNDCYDTGTPGNDDIITFGGGVAGNTITLANGQLRITRGVSISSGGTTTINANRNSRVMEISDGTITLEQLLITGGSAGIGAGILVHGSTTELSLNNSMVSGNSAAGNGGGIYGGGSSKVSLRNSTVSGNVTSSSGGGILARDSSKLSLSNSTVSGNSAIDFGGGIRATNDAIVSLGNSTIAENFANNSGSGIHTGGLADLSLNNSIVANSVNDALECEIVGSSAISVTQDSIIDDSSCGGGTIDDPLLGPLADNGGSTLTHVLLPGSPALDSANVASATTTDQRGLGRVGERDIGAFEVQSLGFSLSAQTMAENAGSVTGTITRSVLLDSPLIVTLNSSDTDSAVVPTDVTIMPGDASASFNVSAVDDLIADGDSSSTITISSIGYLPSSADITVEDNEIPTLTLSLSTSSTNEGAGTITATLSRNTPTNDPLTATLTSSDISSATVPTNVTIDPGEQSVSFDVGVVDDLIADGNGVSTITATLTGFEAGSDALTVVDNDIPTLLLSLSTNSTNEGAGTITATLSRNTPTTGSLTATLISSDTSSATVPTNVTIDPGEQSVSFDVGVVDDLIADGDGTATITATATGLTESAANLEVVDNDVASLSLVLDESFVVESGVTTGNVNRNTPITEALTVILESSDPRVATVLPTVEILIGAMSASFTISGVDNSVIDANRPLTITASGLGSAVNATVVVTDDDDDDSDSVADNLDNCPTTLNPDQADFEGDGQGDACDQDIDGDGMPNQYEEGNGLNPRNSFDRDADADGDGFTNVEEFQFRTDPQVPDQDENGNGIPDAIENKPITLTPILLLLLND